MPSQNLDGWGLDNMYTMSTSVELGILHHLPADTYHMSAVVDYR
jgi:hypothetical protein